MWVWVSFIMVIIVFLGLDLGVFHQNDHVIKSKEARIWTALWITVALSFSGVIYWLFSSGLVENPTGLSPNNAVLKYITGYLIEFSLSIDNVFVIAVIFSVFKVPALYQHRVLFWGILAFVGLKMLFSHQLELPEWVSLTVISVSLLAGVLASLALPDKGTIDPAD